MADYPSDYLWQFFDMEIRTVANGIQRISVDHYLSKGSDEQGDKLDVWKKLSIFMREKKNKETKISYQQSKWFVDSRLQPHGRVKYHWNQTLEPFYGKGTPESYAQFLQVVDFWLTYECKGIYRPEMWQNTPTLQQFADRYMGADCNGFVGGYFATNYPGTGWDTSVDWNNNGLYRGPKRLSINEVKPLDVLVRYIDSKHKHVVIVEDIWSKNGSKATVLITQACGLATGMRSDICTLEIIADGYAKVSGSYAGEFNKGAHGVIGANS